MRDTRAGAFPMTSRRVLIALLALVLTPPAHGYAQEWPNRPVRFVVPFPAGGSTDVAARGGGEYLSRTLGQQVFLENKTGANGNLGMEAAAKSAPDGDPILESPDSVGGTPHVYKMGIDPLKDLVPVIQLSRQPMVLAAHPSLGISSGAESVALAKQEPRMLYATGKGIGSAQHMVVQWFAQLADIKLEQVPYRGGGQAINDLIAGHIKLGSLGSTPLIPFYKAGTLRLLAQSTQARSPSLPDVPTYQEAGSKGLVLDQWLGVFVPVGTPAGIISRLNAVTNSALADATVRESFLQSAQEPIGGSAEQFNRLVCDDFEKYGRLVKELNIKSN